MVGICRLCATIRKEDLLVAIKTVDDELCQQIYDCCNVLITLDDNLPKTVCFECVKTLKMLHVFYNKVQESQESLQSLFKNKNAINLAEEKELPTFTEVVLEIPARTEVDAEEETKQHEVDDKYIAEECEEEEEEYLETDSVLNEEFNIDTIESEVAVQTTNAKLDINNWSDYSWLCFICAEALTSYTALVEHAALMHQLQEQELMFRCTDCHKRCARYFLFFNHVRLRHHAELSYCCDICNLVCENYEQLAQHRDLCSNQQQQTYLVICGKCGKAFRNHNAQMLHERLHHSGTTKSHACQKCGKQFKRAFALRIHQRVHDEAKDYSCHICGHAFRQKINLDMHMYAHSEVKKFECAICKKCFKTSANLDKHGLTHTDIREFKCKFCEKKFRTNDSRTSHERIHTGEKPYKCKYCDKCFRFRSTHVSHLNLHTGERPYKCVECNHQFTNCSNYNKHMKRIHNGNRKQLRE